MKMAAKTLPTEDEILALVSVDDIKRELRIISSAENDLIQEKIVEAYAYFDGPNGWLNRSILTQTWYLYPDAWPADRYGGLEVPIPPLQSVTAITYRDTDGVEQTLPSTDYDHIAGGTSFGYVRLGFDKTWPVLYRGGQPIRIEVVTGYGDAAAVKLQAPGIRAAIKLLAVDGFRNRGATALTTNQGAILDKKIAFGVARRAGMYRLWNNHA
jgi:uncharacterized phiE125 gp8 family phage protein